MVIINSQSPTAKPYALFKNEVSLEKELCQVNNIKHINALARLRLSNHIIEKSRHFRPRIEKNERYFAV